MKLGLFCCFRREADQASWKGTLSGVQSRGLDFCKGAAFRFHFPCTVPFNIEIQTVPFQISNMLCVLLQSFAIFGGVYAFASCIAQRLRQKQDGGVPFNLSLARNFPGLLDPEHLLLLCHQTLNLRNQLGSVVHAAINGGIAGCATGLALGWSGVLTNSH